MIEQPFRKVIVVGAGFSGIAFGCQLKTQLRFDDFVIYDRQEDVGGAWFANQYPGCGVDIPCIFYSLSFAPNPNFSKLFPDQSELLGYIKDVTRKMDLAKHICPNTSWDRAAWIEETKRWRCHFSNRKTGEIFVQECQVLISGVGGLVMPNKLGVKGEQSFKGKIIHSAKWDHRVTLKDKKIVVIGNGCSATQIIPAIIDEVHSLTQFIRTPQYYFPQKNPHIPAALKFVFRLIPGTLTLFRCAMFLLYESTFRHFYLDSRGSRLRAVARQISRRYIEDNAPKRFWPLLMPDYDVGCKRRIFDEGYVSALNKPNIHLTNDPIASIESDEIVTESGQRYSCDILIVANGFNAQHFHLPIRGRNGVTQQEHWARFGGIEAYQSTALADFPNFFMIYGPNAGSGHTSALFSIECTINMVLRLIKPLLVTRAVNTVEVKFEAEMNWVRSVQGALKERVWAGNCGNYYSDKKNRWNIAMYPFSSFHFWYINRFPSMCDWIYESVLTRSL